MLHTHADVEPSFHGVVTVLLDVLANVRGVVRHLVHHLAVGGAEPKVVFEEVAVCVDVGNDQLLVNQRVALLQVGVARIVVDHHLVDALSP